MVDVSIIFVNYNTVKLTCEAINSVINKTEGLRYEIIVVDNASKDNSIATISKKFPEVILIESKTNLGFGKANNLGIEKATGKYIFFLNTDTYLINNAIKILFHFMEQEKNEEVAVVGGMLFKQDLKPNIYAGNFPDYNSFIKNSFLKYFFKAKPLNKVRKIPKKPEEVLEVDYVSGADFFVRKSILDKVGGFDKRFFLYYEETELCHRIVNTIPNSKCVIEPKAEIVHLSQGSRDDKEREIRFRKQFLKSKSIYYTITEGLLKGIIFRLFSLKRFYFNERI